MAHSRNLNPFFTDEDSDSTFSHTKSNSYGGKRFDEHEDRMQRIQSQISASEDRQIESSRRALASLAESESMGLATAEELLHQGEQLNNIERRVTEINSNMTTTQKHLNNIKSVFGGIKNWWTKGKPESQSSDIPEKEPSKLRATVDREKSSRPVRQVDTSGFMEEDDDLDKRFMAGSRGERQMIQKVTNSAREEQINENLGQMSDGLTRLKDLALGLGDEIERQNDQIDKKIKPNVDLANMRIEDQNRQMRNILRK